MIIFWRGRGAAIILFSLLGAFAVMRVASSIGAEFKREDGQVFQIGVNKFSLEDQLFIKKLAEQARAFGQN